MKKRINFMLILALSIFTISGCVGKPPDNSVGDYVGVLSIQDVYEMSDNVYIGRFKGISDEKTFTKADVLRMDENNELPDDYMDKAKELRDEYSVTFDKIEVEVEESIKGNFLEGHFIEDWIPNFYQSFLETNKKYLFMSADEFDRINMMARHFNVFTDDTYVVPFDVVEIMEDEQIIAHRLDKFKDYFHLPYPPETLAEIRIMFNRIPIPIDPCPCKWTPEQRQDWRETKPHGEQVHLICHRHDNDFAEHD